MAKLKFAIVAETEYIDAWQYRCLERLLDGGQAELEAVLLTAATGRARASRAGLGALDAWLGRWVYGRRELKHVAELTGEVPVVPLREWKPMVVPQAPAAVVAGGGGAVLPLVQPDAEPEFDVVLNLAAAADDGQAELPSARYGVWSFRFAGPVGNKLPPGVLEAYQEHATTAVVLERRSGDVREVLRWARQRTRLGCRRNSRELLARASELPRLAVSDLINGVAVSPPEDACAPVFAPDTPSWFAILAASAWKYARRALQYALFDEQWSILIFRNTGVPSQADLRRENALAEVRFPCWKGYGADPFIVETAGKVYLLFEYYPAASRRGRIDAAVFSKDMRLLEYVEDLVPSETHLSYPYLTKTPRGWMLIPEAGGSGSVNYYLLDEPAGPVRQGGSLIEGFAGVDNTVFRHAGKYWMFNTRAVPGWDHETELLLWYADSLHGPWREHPGNPVKIDVTGSRPAGPLFVSGDGDLLRPAQDGSSQYGGGLTLNRIVALDEHRFAEQTVLRVKAADVAAEAIGVHHFCASERYMVIDYKVRKPKLRFAAYLLGERRSFRRGMRTPAVEKGGLTIWSQGRLSE